MHRTVGIAFGAAVLAAAAASLSAAEYVVDNRNPAAADDNPGTWDKPWKTVGRAADVAKAGDTVCVMEGVYDETLAPKNSGRAGAPVLFRGLPRHKAQLKGADTGKTAYVRIEGFHFAGQGVSVGGDHVWIVDNTFEKVRRTTVGGSGSAITVAYNRSVDPSSGVFADGEGWVVEANEIEHMVHRTSECDYGRFFGKGHVFRRNFFHGTAQADVAKSHVDGCQTYHLKNGDQKADNMRFIDNVWYNFHQAIISRDVVGDGRWLSNFVIRGNLFAHGLLPNKNGAAVGLIFENVSGITVEHNLIADVRWFAFSPSRTTSGVIRDNIIYKVGNFDRGTRPKGLKLSDNLIFETKTKDLPQGAATEADPKFVDPAADNWRLRAGSPAIGAGADKSTVGPFAWPNVYYVDTRHPGALDAAGLGHPGRPFKTISHAMKVARPGETIMVYGGVYRECPVATADSVTLKAVEGRRVVISGADLVEGWQRDGDGWVVPMASAPSKVLCDGKPAAHARYDAVARRLRVTSGDPRLSVYEVVVRPHAIDLAGKKVRVEGVTVEATADKGIIGDDKATVVAAPQKTRQP